MSFTNWLMSPRGLALDKFLVRYTGKSLLNSVFARQAGFKPRPALVVETTGRTSGLTRTAALPYFEFDGLTMVVGSRGGMPTDPAWATNLRHRPEAAVYINRKRIPVLARFAEGEEYQRLWPQLTELVPTYAQYQQACATHRQIPVVILEFQQS